MNGKYTILTFDFKSSDTISVLVVQYSCFSQTSYLMYTSAFDFYSIKDMVQRGENYNKFPEQL